MGLQPTDLQGDASQRVPAHRRAAQGQALDADAATPMQLESLLLKFLKVADSHINVRNEQLGLLSRLGVTALLKKRS